MAENVPLWRGALPPPDDMVYPMIDFITCPFCAGHETVSPEAADVIAALIEKYTRGSVVFELETELLNIRNAILNTAQRAQPVEEYEPPICPTPDKRKYSNLAHAQPDATKWHQHAYRCGCGYWHLTKQSATEHSAKINSPAASADEFEAIDPLLT